MKLVNKAPECLENASVRLDPPTDSPEEPDFKEFIRQSGMTHVKTSPYYPQSNGKIERWHQTLKADCIRPHVPLSIDEARQLVERFVDDYNHRRLHSAIGYVAPADKLDGREQAVFDERDRKLTGARTRRARKRQTERDNATAA